MSSMQQEQQSNPKINQIFANKKLTGYDIACNNELSEIVRRDSTDFSTGLIKHKRGRQIVCQLIDVALRPRLLISYLQKRRKQEQSLKRQGQQKQGQQWAQGSVLKSELQESSKEVTTIVYNAIQILTNQYEQFVQFIFGQQQDNNTNQQEINKIAQSSKQQAGKLQKNSKHINKKVNNQDDNDDFADFQQGTKQQMVDINQSEQNQKQQKQSSEESWEVDGVIIDSGYPELKRNQEDDLLKKIISTIKISHNDSYKCLVLDRMLQLFYQPVPLQETPVSYFNKIMLQFVYQKPQQIMRYFYCNKSRAMTKKQKKYEKNSDTINKSKKHDQSANDINLLSSSLNKSTQNKSINNPRIRQLSKHLYNNSVIELLVHVMELESDGNFFCPQKTQMLQSIAQEVFGFSTNKNIKSIDNKNHSQSQEVVQTSTMCDLVEDRIMNYTLVIKQLHEKLQDRYEQQKYLIVFKSFLNDTKMVKQIISYFKQQHNYFDVNGLVVILTQILKFDQVNFVKHKSQQQKSSPFGGTDHFGFSNQSNQSQKQDSSIASYDLRLSASVLQQIKRVLQVLIKKYSEYESSTIRMVQYYELISNWLNITISSKQYQQFNKSQLLTVGFINDCLFKFQEHQRSTILHNAIKNIIVDFLPKFNDAIKIILAPQCELIAFIENYLHVQFGNNKIDKHNKHTQQKGDKKTKKRKVKCFQNQLFHIGKAVLSIWQQQKMLSVMRKTEEQDHLEQKQDDLQHISYRHEYPQSPTSNSDNLIRFEKLREIIQKKEEFYNHLICGDPRKMGEYQQQESSEIIMASSSSLKNFFKPNLLFGNNNNNITDGTNNGQGLMSFDINTNNSNNATQTVHKQKPKDRYGNSDNNEEQFQGKNNKKKLEIEDLKKDTNLKTDPKYKSLRIGEDYGQSLFESAISPLNANRSHTFNFDMDALPLDSDNSQQEAVSQQEQGFFNRKKPCQPEEEMKLMEENIQNFEIVGGNFLVNMSSNILSENNSISQEQSSSNNNISNMNNNNMSDINNNNMSDINNNNMLLLSTDNYRREELSKSFQIPESIHMDNIERVESYIAIESPRKQSSDEILSLGVDSKKSGSKISQQQMDSKLQVVTSQIVVQQNMENEDDENKLLGMDSNIKTSQIEEEMQSEETQMSSNFVRHYSSYLKYNIDDLEMDLQ